jgi:hypothetical protein
MATACLASQSDCEKFYLVNRADKVSEVPVEITAPMEAHSLFIIPSGTFRRIINSD